MTQKFIQQRILAPSQGEKEEFAEITKSVNFDRNQLPQIKLPKANESEIISQSMLSKNAAKVVAKAQARADNTISFGSSKRTRDHMDSSHKVYSNDISSHSLMTE